MQAAFSYRGLHESSQVGVDCRSGNAPKHSGFELAYQTAVIEEAAAIEELDSRLQAYAMQPRRLCRLILV